MRQLLDVRFLRLAAAVVLLGLFPSTPTGGETPRASLVLPRSAPSETATPPDAGNSATEPAPLDWHHWRRRHAQLAEAAKTSDPSVLFLGDSITENWSGPGQDVWAKVFEPLGAANFGIAGDRTQSLRWRIDKGDYARMNPETVVVLIGTNNLKNGRNTPEETTAGVAAVVGDCLRSFPQAEILLMTVLPCMEDPSDPHAVGVGVVNAAIGSLADGTRVKLLDLGELLVGADGRVSAELMPDYLHPNQAGYRRLAEGIQSALHR